MMDRAEASNTSLSGKVALVTGAARGLGVAIGRDLAALGWHVIVAARDGQKAEEVAAGSKGKLPPIILESHAIHRFAGVDKVAAAIVFLAGPDAGFITGSIIDVNGGFTA